MTNRKQLIKELDTLWSEIIRSRGKCEKCGRTDTLAAHHYHRRVKFNTRWDLENGVCLCFYHHIYWAHKDTDESRDWFHDKLGEEKFNNLKIRARISGKGLDLQAIKIYLEKQNDCHSNASN
jgi:hypothetical protein